MKEKLQNPSIYLGILGILIAYHLLSNITWIALSTAPVPWDQAGHTRLALQFADYFTSFGFLRIIDYFSISTYYPPLIHTIVGILTILFGHPTQTAEIVISLFFGFSIFLIYVYALDLFKSEKIALLGALIFSFLPIIYEHSRWFLLEIPQITFLLLCLIFLNRSGNFSDKRNVMYFFISLGLAALTKWTSLVYIFVPFMISASYWIRSLNEHKNISKSPLFRYLLIFIVITAPWYLINFSTFISKSLPNLQGESSDPANIRSLQNFVFYLQLFINFQVTLFVSLIFLIASVYFFLIHKNRYKLLFGGTIFFIYLLFSLISNKDWRYTLPVLPFVAIILGVFLNYMLEKFKITGKTVVLLFILILISYHIILSFRPLTLTYQRAIKVPIIGWIDYININDNLSHAYNRSIWPQKEILTKLRPINQRTWILCLVDQERFNPGNLFLERDTLGMRNFEIESPPPLVFETEEESKAYLLKFSYVLIAEDKLGNPATRNIEVFYQLKNSVERKDSGFKKTKKYNLPNGDKLILYERL